MKLQQVNVALTYVEKAFSVVLLLSIVALIFAQVVARYIFNAPLFWSDELARYSYVWLCFIAASFVVAERSHIRIDLLNSFLGKRMKLAVEAVVGMVVVGICVVFVVGSWPWLMTTIRPVSPALRMPMVWLYGVVMFAFGLMALHSVINVLSVLLGEIETDDGLTTE